jgi:hypothetical protein
MADEEELRAAMQPTRRPWRTFDEEPMTIDGPLVRDRGLSSEPIAEMTNGVHRNRANAALILTAVNGREAVLRAWTEEGFNPEWHKMWQDRLRIEWPTLYEAIIALIG